MMKAETTGRYLPEVYFNAGGTKARGKARDMSEVLAENPERFGANEIRAKEQGHNQKGIDDMKEFTDYWKILADDEQIDQGENVFDDLMRVYRDGEVRHLPTLAASTIVRMRLEGYLQARLTIEDLKRPDVIERFNAFFAPLWIKMAGKAKMLAGDKKTPDIDAQKMDIIRYLVAYANHSAL